MCFFCVKQRRQGMPASRNPLQCTQELRQDFSEKTGRLLENLPAACGVLAKAISAHPKAAEAMQHA